VLVDSGSSAVLLGLGALLESGKIRAGDEVVLTDLASPAMMWALRQLPLVPVLVDVDPYTWNISTASIPAALSSSTRILVASHVMGNPCDMTGIRQVAEEHDLIVFEDCRDSLGAAHRDQPAGSFGEISSFRLNASDHATVLHAGLCVVRERRTADVLRGLRAKEWRVQAGFSHVPLQRIGGFRKERAENVEYWRAELTELTDFFEFQDETAESRHSWCGFPLVVKESAPFSRVVLTSYLHRQGIETRAVSRRAGLLDPAAPDPLVPSPRARRRPHSTWILNNAFATGNHRAVSGGGQEYLIDCFHDFLRDGEWI
jgi:CDP-6-deoxy-D-xylo-4-hexulose-3-dehydrase